MLFGIHGAYQKTELTAIISLVRSEPLSDSTNIVPVMDSTSLRFAIGVCTERLTCLGCEKDLASGPTRRDSMTVKRRLTRRQSSSKTSKSKWHAYSCNISGHS